jgi:class 3 adenylate cyclase
MRALGAPLPRSSSPLAAAALCAALAAAVVSAAPHVRAARATAAAPPAALFALPCGALLTQAVSALTSWVFSHGGDAVATNQAWQALLQACVAALTATHYCVRAWSPALPPPWDALTQPCALRLLTWLLAAPALLAQAAVFCRVRRATWQRAAVTVTAALITLHLLSSVAASRALRAALSCAALALFCVLMRTLRAWLDAALLLTHEGAQQPARRNEMQALRMLTAVAWCSLPAAQAAGACVSPHAQAALWVACDLLLCVVWSRALLLCGTLRGDVTAARAASTLDALDLRRIEQFTASLLTERASNRAMLDSMHALVQEVSAPLSVIAGLSDNLLSDAGMDADARTPRSSFSAAVAPRTSVPRTSFSASFQQRCQMSLSVIRDSTLRVMAEFASFVQDAEAATAQAAAAAAAAERASCPPLALQPLLEACMAACSPLLPPSVRLVNAVPAAPPLLVANGARVQEALHAALQLLNRHAGSGDIVVSAAPHADDAGMLELRFTCEQTPTLRGSASESNLELSFDDLSRMATSLGGAAAKVHDMDVCLVLPCAANPADDDDDDAEKPRSMSLTRRWSFEHVEDVVAPFAEPPLAIEPPSRPAGPRASIVVGAGTAAAWAASSRRGSFADKRAARPRLLCIRVEDEALLLALRDAFVLSCVAADGNDLLERLSDAEPPVTAVLVGGCLESATSDANVAMQASIVRVRATSPSMCIMVVLSGATETLVSSAAVATALATVAALAAASQQEALVAVELAAALVHLSPLVDSSALSAATASVLEAPPASRLGSLDEMARALDAPSSAEAAALLGEATVKQLAPILASAPALAEAVTTGALKAAEELSSAVSCAALHAGASKCFILPLLRSDLVDGIVSFLRSAELAVESANSATLLRKLLPERVSERLKSGQSFCAEAMPSVAILFCDIVQFTVIASLLDPIQIIVLLNELFSAFDALMTKYGVFKVESACTRTRMECFCAYPAGLRVACALHVPSRCLLRAAIGDCYMCVSGHDGAPLHAARMLALAGEMLEVRSRARLPRPAREADLLGVSRDVREDFERGSVRVRIGFHAGAAVAGVVGGLMPRYWCARSGSACQRTQPHANLPMLTLTLDAPLLRQLLRRHGEHRKPHGVHLLPAVRAPERGGARAGRRAGRRAGVLAAAPAVLGEGQRHHGHVPAPRGRVARGDGPQRR